MARTIGLLAGVGRLPELLIEAAHDTGDQVVAIRTLPDALPSPSVACSQLLDIFIGQWNEIVQSFKRAGVERVYIAGKISREHLFQSRAFDERFQSILARVPAKNDEAVIEGFVSDLEREGLPVGEQTEYLQTLFCPGGILTAVAPRADQWEDIVRGYNVAKTLAGLDVGQTTVLKDGSVVAVEAVEGTDQAIARGTQIARGGTVVVKVAKPNQDLRFDVPTIGMETLQVMAQYGASVLAFDAGLTLLLEKDDMVAFANSHQMSLVSYDPQLDMRESCEA